MNYRSSNAGQHLSNDIVAGVASSHGVQLSGGSTGGIVQAVGDDTDISLNLRAKGAGSVILGDSSNVVNLGNGSTLVTVGATGGQVQLAGSTAPFRGMVRVISTAIATPDFNSTGLMGVISTHTVAGLDSSHVVLANAINVSTAVSLNGAWVGSTANSVNLKWSKHSTVTIAASTATIRFLIFRF